MLGKIEGRRRKEQQDEMVGWHHWLYGHESVNSGSWWWTGRPGVLRFMGSRRAGHDWATELNWHDAIGKEPTCQCSRHKDVSSIPGWGRSSGEGNGNPLQFLAWRIPWTEEPGRLQSMGSQSRTRLTWLSTAQHSRVYMSMLLSQCIPLFASHAVSTSPFSTSVSLFLPCKQAHQYHFSRVHICALTYDICFSLPDLLRFVYYLQSQCNHYQWRLSRNQNKTFHDLHGNTCSEDPEQPNDPEKKDELEQPGAQSSDYITKSQ